MTSHVHSFDPREGGTFRVSLTYGRPTGAGKTGVNTDTYHGRFAQLVTNERIVEVIEFESEEASLQGEMTITTTLVETGGGTEVIVDFDGLPRGVSTADNETGTRMALGKLAALVEAG